MGINIGNNNKIKNSVIGNNKIEQEKSSFSKILISLLITIIAGLIVGYCIYKFGWNSSGLNLEDAYDNIEHLYTIKDLEDGILNKL